MIPGIISWAPYGDADYTQVTRTSNGPAVNNDQIISWTEAPRNPFDVWDAGDPSRLTIPSGWTHVRLFTSIHVSRGSGNVLSHLGIRILKNGSSEYLISPGDVAQAGRISDSHFSISTPILEVVEGDYFEIQIESGVFTVSVQANDGYSTTAILERASIDPGVGALAYSTQPNAAGTGIVPFGGEIYDPDGMYSQNANSDRMFIPEGMSKINIRMQERELTHGNGELGLEAWKNNERIPLIGLNYGRNAGDSIHFVEYGPTAVSQGDYIQLNHVSNDDDFTRDGDKTWIEVENITGRDTARVFMTDPGPTGINANPGPYIIAGFENVDHDDAGFYDAVNQRLRIPAGKTRVRVGGAVFIGGLDDNVGGAGDNKITARIRMRDSAGNDLGIVSADQEIREDDVYFPTAGPPIEVNAGNYFEMEILTNHDNSINISPSADAPITMWIMDYPSQPVENLDVTPIPEGLSDNYTEVSLSDDFSGLSGGAPIPWSHADNNGLNAWEESQPTRLTVPPGVQYVRLYYTGYMGGGGGSWIGIRFKKNDSVDFDGATWIGHPNKGGDEQYTIESPILEVSPGDYFEAENFTNSGTVVARSTRDGFVGKFIMEAVESVNGAFLARASTTAGNNTTVALPLEDFVGSYDEGDWHDEGGSFPQQVFLPEGINRIFAVTTQAGNPTLLAGTGLYINTISDADSRYVNFTDFTANSGAQVSTGPVPVVGGTDFVGSRSASTNVTWTRDLSASWFHIVDVTDVPAARIETSQSVAGVQALSTSTPLTGFDTVEFDDNNFYDAVNDRLRVPVDTPRVRVGAFFYLTNLNSEEKVWCRIRRYSSADEDLGLIAAGQHQASVCSHYMMSPPITVNEGDYFIPEIYTWETNNTTVESGCTMWIMDWTQFSIRQFEQRGIQFKSFTGHGSPSKQIIDTSQTPSLVLLWSSLYSGDRFERADIGPLFTAAIPDGDSIGWAAKLEDGFLPTENDSVFRQNTYAITKIQNNQGIEQPLATKITAEEDGFGIQWVENNIVARNGGLIFPPECDAKVGTVILGSGATGNLSVTGLGFQPKLVIFTSPFFDNVINGAAENAEMRVGYAVSAADQFATAQYGEHGANPKVASSCLINDGCILGIDQTTIKLRASYVSADVDGFTINVTVPPNLATRIGYVAIGGDGFEAKTGTIIPTAGDVATTGVGFKPDVVMFNGWGNFASGTVALNVHQAWGMASRVNQLVNSISHENGAGGNSNYVFQSNQHCLAFTNAGSLATQARARMLSLDDDGFTLNFSGSLASWSAGYVAMKFTPPEE